MAEEGGEGRRPSLRVVAGGPEAPAEPGRGWGAGPGVTAGAGPTRLRSVDEGLVAAFLVGDADAFGELFRRHQGLVHAIVRRHARTPEDARDLVQRTFLRALEAARRSLRRGLDSGDAPPFRRWLVRIAVNLAKNHLRDEARHPRAPLEALGAAEGQAATAPADLERAQAAARIRRLVPTLPPRQREVLTLRIDAELPFAEIALALGITENAAKVTFHHATRRLRALVSEDAS